MMSAAIVRLEQSRCFGLAARALLTLPFWAGGLAKLADWQGAVGEARHFGLEPAPLIALATIVTQLGGSALVIAAWGTWLGAGALGVFTLMATVIAHPFWTAADPVIRFHERNTFLEHLGLLGGPMIAAILATREHRE